ncbi:MAG: DinB family protein [Gemmatimonas sp.]|nr:DinB family protein [Gemmatimonas sp.]
MTDLLPPRIHELLTELDRTQQAMRAVLASLPPEHANTVVRDGSWSVAQVVEHLLLVEDWDRSAHLDAHQAVRGHDGRRDGSGAAHARRAVCDRRCQESH